MSKLEFPSLEELYLQDFGNDVPGLLNFHAPRLISLRVSHFLPSDLRHISNSRSPISIIHLKSHYRGDTSLWETYLPRADRLQLDLNIGGLFVLNVHPSQIHSVTMNINWNEDIICPPHWTGDYISEMLGTVTALNLECFYYFEFEDSPQTIVSLLEPFMYLKHLALSRLTTNFSSWIDQLAQRLVDPKFLPALEALSTSEHPFWPDFFQYIQRRQSGFLTGQFQTSLKEITIKGPVHGALLESLRESLAGRYVGVPCMPPRRKGSKEWPMQPFDCQKLDTNGILCCYCCYKAGLEIGCTILPSRNASEMLQCRRSTGD